MRMLRNTLSYAALVTIVVAAVGYIGALGVRATPPDNRTRLALIVANINGLVAGSNVLLRGVPVGKVTAIHPDVAGATIDFYVDRAHP
ncbi:MAG TPA: MlaD family protein, partial [Mycobacterium sp.]|nr:MlaD family protein [Mycobacterium sp.]